MAFRIFPAPPAHLILVAILASTVAFAQAQKKQTEPKSRDLIREKLDDPNAPAPVSAAPVIEPKRSAVPRGYALVIGIAQYKNLASKDQLKFPERDAERMYSILISPEGGNFRAENVRKLVGPDATLGNIRKQLDEWLPAATHDDDRVLIYFAGHGFVLGGKAYLAPYDIDPDDITRTGYPMDDLGKSIGSKVRGKWKVLLTDSCHSGAITPATDAMALNTKLGGLAPSLFSMTASRDRELSYESPDWGGGHGVFTYYVVEGLQGQADSNGDGIVTADELGNYVSRNVREATRGLQNPTFDRGSYDNSMQISYPPARAITNLPKPREGTLVIEVNMDGTEVFVNGVSKGIVNTGTPLRLPGLAEGNVTVKGVHAGYVPDGPREERVYPGQETPVSISIKIRRPARKASTDAFDKGFEEYNKGTQEHYRKAVEWFERSLDADPQNGRSALFAARAYHALYDEDLAKAHFEKAIAAGANENDPDFVLEARANFAGMLLDTGETDEAIRQLDQVLTRQPRQAQALANQSQALFRKKLYADAIQSARKAIEVVPNYAEAHLWLAEALRASGSQREAVDAYQQFIDLSAYDSGVAGKVNYYVVGFLVGMGRKQRASQTDIWREMRSLAYFGMCDCERLLRDYDAAIQYCHRALAYDPKDPFAHYALGLAYHYRATTGDKLANLTAARQHYVAMLSLNSDLEEAKFARQNLANVDRILSSLAK